MPTDTIFQIIILIMSVVIHEVSHGFMAGILGDPTAKLAGRLTLNPIKHIDLFGSILVPGFLVLTHSPFLLGWAKPVPFNPYNLRGGKWGPAYVALAGPLSNIFVALFFGLILRFGLTAGLISLALAQIISVVIWINIYLSIFNLVPVPPLDGSKILFALFPYKWHNLQRAIEQYSIFLIIFILFFAGDFLSPLAGFLFTLFTGLN